MGPCMERGIYVHNKWLLYNHYIFQLCSACPLHLPSKNKNPFLTWVFWLNTIHCWWFVGSGSHCIFLNLAFGSQVPSDSSPSPDPWCSLPCPKPGGRISGHAKKWQSRGVSDRWQGTYNLAIWRLPRWIWVMSSRYLYGWWVGSLLWEEPTFKWKT